jgi:hypothetical protein
MSVLKRITDRAAAAVGLRSAVQVIHDGKAELNAALAEAEAEKAQLLGAKPPRAELEAELDRDLTSAATQWFEQHAGQLLTALAPSIIRNASGGYTVTRYASLGHVLPGVLELGALAALFPAQIRAGILGAIPPYVPGPPMSARPGLLSNVDARIAEIEREHQALVSEAGAAGIAIPELEGNRARRIAEEHRAERAAREARDTKPRGDRG